MDRTLSRPPRQAPPKPSAPPVNLDAIPAQLRERRQWVLWRYVLRTDRKTGKRMWRKVPFQPNGTEASAKDPATWNTFDRVVATYHNAPEFWDGIGYEFSADDPFVGIDLDGSRQDDGAIIPWFAELRAKFAAPGVPDPLEIIKKLATYAEISPSGTGFKLIGVGHVPGTRKELDDPMHDHHGIGIYDRGRYFTFTGQRVPGTPATVNDCSKALEEIYSGIFGKVAPKSSTNGNGKVNGNGYLPTDEKIWEVISHASNAQKIIALRNGDTTGYASTSEADAGLAFHLAFYSRDAEQIERLMRSSALVRDKWDRKDYIGPTITGALEKVTDTFDWNRSSGAGVDISAIVGREVENQFVGVPPLSSTQGRTEVANGKRLANRHGKDIRWCDLWGKWFAWDGKRWAIDDRRILDAHAKEVYQALWKETGAFGGMIKNLGDEEVAQAKKTLAEMIRFAKATGGAHSIESMLKLTRSEAGIAIGPDVLDSDPWLLNCQNGTIDLRTGDLHPHRREDYLTKLCPVAFDPKADCPLWLETLRDIMAGDEALLKFIRRAVGLTLTGVVRDHALFFCYGTGANGKSTFIGTMQEVMGADYAMKAPPDLLMAKGQEAHPTERADLAGKRFIACIEAGEGRRLAESLVKELTGGDRVRARRMREDFWEFSPTHKIWLAANHKPIIRGTDWGIWRRIKLIPFTVRIPDDQQDKALADKLKAELPGILNWAILGCIEWQHQGLGEPEAVRRATAEYRSESDILGLYIDECCEVGSDQFEVAAAALYANYKSWAERQGERHTMTQNSFGAALTERGFVRDRYTAGTYKGRYRWIGIQLHHQEELPQ